MKSLWSMAVRVAVDAVLRRPPGAGIPSRPEVYGLSIFDPVARDRAEGVFRWFFAGLEAALRRPWSAPRPLDCAPPLFLPFYNEGAAMGWSFARAFSLRGLPSIEGGTFSRDMPYAFMTAIGIGFALGFLTRDPRRVSRAARRIGNHGPLVWDGYGFCRGLFGWRGSAAATIASLDGIEAAGRLSAASGLGRSLWFRYMDRPGEAIEAARGTGQALALLGGLGLASAFTFPDDLGRGYGIADRLEGEELGAFRKGTRIALFVRDRDGATYQDEQIARLGEPLVSRARSDLAAAKEADARTRDLEDYIDRFHERCSIAGVERMES
jgi:hypothetical protein